MYPDDLFPRMFFPRKFWPLYFWPFSSLWTEIVRVSVFVFRLTSEVIYVHRREPSDVVTSRSNFTSLDVVKDVEHDFRLE